MNEYTTLTAYSYPGLNVQNIRLRVDTAFGCVYDKRTGTYPLESEPNDLRAIKQMTDAECVAAYRLHMSGEGCAMISGYGEICSYNTADAMINRGRRIVEAEQNKETK